MCSCILTLTCQLASIPPQPHGNRQGKAFSKKFGVLVSLSSESTLLHGGKSLTSLAPCFMAYPPSFPSFHKLASPHIIISFVVIFARSVSIMPETCSCMTSGLSPRTVELKL